MNVPKWGVVMPKTEERAAADLWERFALTGEVSE